MGVHLGITVWGAPGSKGKKKSRVFNVFKFVLKTKQMTTMKKPEEEEERKMARGGKVYGWLTGGQSERVAQGPESPVGTSRWC